MTRRETTAKRAMRTAAGTLVREPAGPSAPGWRRVLLHVLGLGLLIATGAIHLDVYLTGYRMIPAISRLFLLQVIAAFGLGRLRSPSPAGWRPQAPAGFALGGHLVVWIGLLEFTVGRTTAASPPVWWRRPLPRSWPPAHRP